MEMLNLLNSTIDKDYIHKNTLIPVDNRKCLPIKFWLSEVESGAIEQAYNVARLPFAFHHIACMPDMHQGYGMPIGTILATKGYVVPNAVGVDIGCGMCAIRTSLFTGSLDKIKLKKIMGDIRKLIPVGFKHQKNPQDGMPDHLQLHENGIIDSTYLPIVDSQYQSAKKQLGTLGGGNHFIEIQQGDDGYIWLMIHSGSRNLGKKVADHYNKIAVDTNEIWFSQVPKKWQLAFLPINEHIGKKYLDEMAYCVEFAFANRKHMMNNVKEAMRNHVDVDFFEQDFINIAHNYASMEHHFGQNVLIHRKGATRAYEGELGIIPGSQGTSSYIVKGKGNKESFKSCSHGAGRQMGRKKAQETLNLKDEIQRLDDQGIVHGIRSKKDLDEASGAYKNINTVMNNQKDLVDIVIELKPLAVIKG
jgi:tRNA-splicing ligase RtcB